MADANNIKADNEYIPSEATRSSWFSVDRDYLSSIGYPTSGKGKHAQLSYQINSGTVVSEGATSTVSVKELMPYKLEEVSPTLTYISYADDLSGSLPVTIVRIAVSGAVTTWEKSTNIWDERADGPWFPING